MRPSQVMIIGYPTHAMTSRLHDELVARGHRSWLIHPDRVVTQVAAATVTVQPTLPHLDVVVLTTSTDHLTALHTAAHGIRRTLRDAPR